MKTEASAFSKVAIVTGGSSGIGLSTVRVLLNKGLCVVSGDIVPIDLRLHDDLISHKEQGRLLTLIVDVTKWVDLSYLFDQTFKAYSRIDYVLVNAGVIQIGPPLLDDDVDEHGHLREPDHRTLDVCLIAAMNTAKLAIWYMKRQRADACIVFVASTCAFQAFPPVHYTVAKHGVIGLMRSLGVNLVGTGIRVNAVAPSWTESGLISRKLAEFAGIPLQQPESVANSILDLFSNVDCDGLIQYVEDGRQSEIGTELRRLTESVMPCSSGKSHIQECKDFIAALAN